MAITAATMANTGPAMSFFFGFGLTATAAGIASPVTIVAGIAVVLPGSRPAQFIRVLPSTGGSISFVGRTFGGRVGVATLMAGMVARSPWPSICSSSGRAPRPDRETDNPRRSIPRAIFTSVGVTVFSYLAVLLCDGRRIRIQRRRQAGGAAIPFIDMTQATLDVPAVRAA